MRKVCVTEYRAMRNMKNIYETEHGAMRNACETEHRAMENFGD